MKQKAVVGLLLVLLPLALGIAAMIFVVRSCGFQSISSGKGFIGANMAELPGVDKNADSVYIRDANLTNEALSEFISMHPRLRKLRVTESALITADGISGLENCQHLITLDLSHTSVSDDISITLAKITTLEFLILRNTRVTTLDTSVFRSNRGLVRLDVSECTVSRELVENCAGSGLEQLDLNECEFKPGVNLAALSTSVTLKRIYLIKTSQTIDILDALCAIRSLESLSIVYVKGVSSAEIQQLRSRHPRVEIAYAD